MVMLASDGAAGPAGGLVLLPQPATMRRSAGPINPHTDRNSRMGSAPPLGERVAGPHAQALQHDRQRAEARERGLQQVGADKGREPKPIAAHKMREKQTHEHDCARKSHDPAINAHNWFPRTEWTCLTDLFDGRYHNMLN